MSFQMKLNDLRLELSIAADKVKKFKQVDDNAFLNRVRGSKPEVLKYCEHVFHDTSKPAPHYLDSHDGKEVHIYCNGRIAFKGKIAYLRRWFDSRMLQYRLQNQVNALERKVATDCCDKHSPKVQ